MPSQKILVADDSLTTKKIIQLVLANEGYEIRTASDGKETLQQIVLFQPDVVLLDVSLPDQNAYQIKEKINTTPEGPKTRFILMSSAFETVDEAKAKSLGFAARIVKPFEPSQLKQVLAKVMGGANHRTSFDSPEPPSSPPPFSLELEPSIESSIAPFDTTPPPPPHSSMAPVDEIKQLADSTMNAIGYSEYSWAVNEPAAQQPPPPSYPTPDLWIENKPFDPNRKSDFEMPNFENIADTGNSTFALDEKQSLSVAQSEPRPQAASPDIRKLVEEEIKKLVPEIAEKVIRAEIHRLLSKEL